MKKNCGNCYWARWERSASGRRNLNVAGKCVVPVKLPEKLPESWLTAIGDERAPVWADGDDGEKCELFLDKDADPKSIGWSKERPKTPGFYWIRKNDRVWSIKVWCHEDEPKKLYTNEDGAAPITDDELYGGAEFKGPFSPDDP